MRDGLNLYDTTIHQGHRLLTSGQFSSVELTKAALERISRVEEKLHAIVTVTEDTALHQAEEADKVLHGGSPTPLTGIPVVIKDNMCTRGIRTTCSSRMLEGFVPPYDATVVEKLTDAGMVLVGKGNMDEFAMGSSNEHSAFFITHNPWDLSTSMPWARTPGAAFASRPGSAVSLASNPRTAECQDTAWWPSPARLTRSGR
jgi:aspartyl-tRNA(Asn)/glutamyl-tRNA(Gln) amidotransferase subunit A